MARAAKQEPQPHCVPLSAAHFHLLCGREQLHGLGRVYLRQRGWLRGWAPRRVPQSLGPGLKLGSGHYSSEGCGTSSTAGAQRVPTLTPHPRDSSFPLPQPPTLAPFPESRHTSPVSFLQLYSTRRSTESAGGKETASRSNACVPRSCPGHAGPTAPQSRHGLPLSQHRWAGEVRAAALLVAAGSLVPQHLSPQQEMTSAKY